MIVLVIERIKILVVFLVGSFVRTIVAGDDCDLQNTFWISPPFNTTFMSGNGTTGSYYMRQMNLTITYRQDCLFIGVESLRHGENGEMIDEVAVSGIILPSMNNMTQLKMVMTATGESFDADATIDLNTGVMIYDQIKRLHASDLEPYTILVSTTPLFPPGTDPSEIDYSESDCVDFSGIWYDDPHVLHIVHTDGREEVFNPILSTENYTQTGCVVTGVHTGETENFTGHDYVVGLVKGNHLKQNVVPKYDTATSECRKFDIDAFMDTFEDLNQTLMKYYYVETGCDYIATFDAIFERDTPPYLNEDPFACKINNSVLVGTWTSTSDVDAILIDSNMRGAYTTLDTFNFYITHQENCVFFGYSDKKTFFVGQVHYDGKTTTYTEQVSINNYKGYKGVSYFNDSKAEVISYGNTEDSFILYHAFFEKTSSSVPDELLFSTASNNSIPTISDNPNMMPDELSSSTASNDSYPTISENSDMNQAKNTTSVESNQSSNDTNDTPLDDAEISSPPIDKSIAFNNSACLVTLRIFIIVAFGISLWDSY